MIQVEFNYQQQINIIIQANSEEKFEIVARKFINKTQLEINKIAFLSNGRTINMDDVIQNIMSNLERQYKTMKVLVVPMNTLRNEICNNNSDNNDNYIQCHEVICPVCQ